MKELYLKRDDLNFEIDVKDFLILESKPEEVIEYLKTSHKRFEHDLIPRIEQNFLSLIRLIPNSKSLPIILNLFIKFQTSLKVHMEIEEKFTFPSFLNKSITVKSSYENSISHEEQEPFLTEIIKFLRNSKFGNNPFCQLLIQRLENFDAELKRHSWIEEKIINS